jgi:hypothetical protein
MRFEAKDDKGGVYTIIEYSVLQESDEIRPDRMRADPNIQTLFKTVDGRDLEQNADGTFSILGTLIVLRKVGNRR